MCPDERVPLITREGYADWLGRCEERQIAAEHYEIGIDVAELSDSL